MNSTYMVNIPTNKTFSDNNSHADIAVDGLIELFDRCFYSTYNTRLVRGDDEPVYLPADDTIAYHRIVFAHGFFSSALHEVAHWCIAGEARRQLEDYGYWYCPDGRNAQQQQAFEHVEVKPQAIEWAFTLAAGRKFTVSTDNLNGAEPDREGFSKKVAKQLLSYVDNGFPHRATLFIAALQGYFSTPLLDRCFVEECVK
ncbi:elongation factor P hydroxylase [Alteromonas sp. C1M14]|uniref:elongation factor P hydroxylase n=1 Tax=Alteromonas sp. C1M14 TaxID=2841567 RepID=UPI001C0A2F2D|nr:elongation factor P hydroxylase [Alteromonas sp. C1M14]MBU2979754.1 elongation factor P hydroxylase [Alteromonas sp. C1M14]